MKAGIRKYRKAAMRMEILPLSESLEEDSESICNRHNYEQLSLGKAH